MATQMSVPARWPAGPLSWAVLIAYVASLAIAFFPESRKYSGLMELWHLELNVFRTEEMVQRLMTAAIGARTVEAIIALVMCHRAGLQQEQAAGWAVITLLLGYAAILPLRKAISAATAASTAKTAAVKGS